jgi:ABC-2 type transport system ATP-binding protein
MPAIEAIGLEREYKGGLKAVDGIDLAVEPGEVYGFLGPNGAGKTTTVRMLVTLLGSTSRRNLRRSASASASPSRRPRSTS